MSSRNRNRLRANRTQNHPRLRISTCGGIAARGQGVLKRAKAVFTCGGEHALLAECQAKGADVGVTARQRNNLGVDCCELVQSRTGARELRLGVGLYETR